ncbi:galactose-specific lectin nattectin-like [Genypterus blacodes]|uniref:galactose-specific lectin nattectin-like n=1 Tax=Genypterus blacodes TaxID=154954 RepID=UPI003F76810D
MRCVWLTVCAALLLLMITQETDAISRGRVLRNCRRVKLQRCYGVGGGWYSLDSKRCFKVYGARWNFNRAEAYCRRLCGDLVSIHNVHQYNRVLCRLAKYSSRRYTYWIGGERLSNGKYGWTDGSKWNFSRWHKGQPDFYRKRERCAEMNWGNSPAAD